MIFVESGDDQMNYHSLRRGILPAESLPRLSGGGRFGEFINHSIHPCLAYQAGTGKVSGLLERL